jgi:hypothetical protein
LHRAIMTCIMDHPGFVDELTELADRLSPTPSTILDAFFSFDPQPAANTRPMQPRSAAHVWNDWMVQSNNPPTAFEAGFGQARRPFTDLPTSSYTVQHNARVADLPSVQRATALPTAAVYQDTAYVDLTAVTYERPRGEPDRPIFKSTESAGASSHPFLSHFSRGSIPSPRPRASRHHPTDSRRSHAQVETCNPVIDLQALSLRISELEGKVEKIASRFTPPPSTKGNSVEDDSQFSSAQGSPNVGSGFNDAEAIRLSCGNPHYNILLPFSAVNLNREQNGKFPRESPLVDRYHGDALQEDMHSASGLLCRADPIVGPHHGRNQPCVIPSSSRASSTARNSTGHCFTRGFGYADHHAAWNASQDAAQRAQIDDLQMRLQAQAQYLEYYHSQATSQQEAHVQAYSALEYWYNPQAAELRAARDRIVTLERVKTVPVPGASTRMEPQMVGRRRTHHDRVEQSASGHTQGFRASRFVHCNGPGSETTQFRSHEFGRPRSHWLTLVQRNQARFADSESSFEIHPPTIVIDRPVPSFAAGGHDMHRCMPATSPDLTNRLPSAGRSKSVSNIPLLSEGAPHAIGTDSMPQCETGMKSPDHWRIEEHLTVPHIASPDHMLQNPSASFPSTRRLQPWVEDDNS